MPTSAAPTNIAYLTSRFPKISETFVLDEVLELRRRGCTIELFALLPGDEEIVHPEASELDGHVHAAKPISRATLAVLAAQVGWLRRSPRRYLHAWRRGIRGNARWPRFLLRSLVVIPVAAQWAAWARDNGIEHIHAHWATHPALAALVMHDLTGLPFSFTAHAHDLMVNTTMLAEKMRPAYVDVTISERNRTILAALAPDAAENIQVIHCGVDLRRFVPAEETNLPPSETPTLVCIARLEEMKGHRYLIDACALLQQHGVRFRCLLIGDGSERAAITQQIEQYGLAEHVSLLGAQPRDAVRQWLADADVVVLPSVVTEAGRTEGIPVALMEALAMRRPVVATAVSGVPELITDGVHGRLVPPRDAVALADALEALLQDRALAQRLAAAGRAHVEEAFDLQTNVARLHGLFGKTSAT